MQKAEAISLRDHALGALLHPVSLLAVAVQLVNDHILRLVIPSPLWGKLGDVTMLIYAPLLGAALLALAAPFRSRRAVALTGFGIVGTWFALGKTVPAVLAATNGLVSWLTGRPSLLILDPTDLIALPALGVAWWIWQRPVPMTRDAVRPLGAAALCLAWLTTVATSIPMLDEGIVFVCTPGQRLLALSSVVDDEGRFLSDDGGLSWRPQPGDEPIPDECLDNGHGLRQSWTIEEEGTQRQYRLTEAVGVEQSDDGGATWQFVYDARVDAISGAYAEEIEFGPLDAALDPGTDNLVVAMGRRGVLVIKPDNSLQWATLGPYTRVYTPQSGLVHVLQYPLMLGVILVPAAVFFMAHGSLPGPTDKNTNVLGLVLFACIAVPWLFTFPAGNWQARIVVSDAESIPLSQTPLAVLVLLAPIAGLMGYQTLQKAAGGRRIVLLQTLLLAFLTGIVFLVPFGLWAFTGYPEFGNQGTGSGPSPAVLVAGLMAFLVILGGRTLVHWQLKKGRQGTQVSQSEATT